MTQHIDVAIVGGGQAGLSLSYYLQQRGIDHRVFEKERALHAWTSQRWDTFCLVTPNWQCKLPGHYYRGSDPDGARARGPGLSHHLGRRGAADPDAAPPGRRAT